MPSGVYKHSIEHNRKLSEAKKGSKNPMFGGLTEEHKKKISKSLIGNNYALGNKMSKEYLVKLKERVTGNKNPMFGKTHTLETREKIRQHKLGKSVNRGIKNGNWKGGVTPELIMRVCTAKWDKIRKEVYKRDNWTCKICGKTKCMIHAHHIVPYRITNDNSLNNLITLCSSCHKIEEWKYYKKLKGQMEFTYV